MLKCVRFLRYPSTRRCAWSTLTSYIATVVSYFNTLSHFASRKNVFKSPARIITYCGDEHYWLMTQFATLSDKLNGLVFIYDNYLQLFDKIIKKHKCVNLLALIFAGLKHIDCKISVFFQFLNQSLPNRALKQSIKKF